MDSCFLAVPSRTPAPFHRRLRPLFSRPLRPFDVLKGAISPPSRPRPRIESPSELEVFSLKKWFPFLCPLIQRHHNIRSRGRRTSLFPAGRLISLHNSFFFFFIEITFQNVNAFVAISPCDRIGLHSKSFPFHLACEESFFGPVARSDLFLSIVAFFDFRSSLLEILSLFLFLSPSARFE